MNRHSVGNEISYEQEQCGPYETENHCMSAQPEPTIPPWLERPPCSPINPPIRTRAQELPFGKLSWEDFERLCLRLVRKEATVEECRQYGTPGQRQEGIDIYALRRLTPKYTVYQCKRVNNFGPAKIRNAVSKFRKGKWISRAEAFVLCTKESLRSTQQTEELENQREILKQTGIKLRTWDSEKLSLKLKEFPKVVDDFFGRAWVAAFCGQKEAESLGKRLKRDEVAEFRKKFAFFYKNIFNTHDPGLPITTVGQTASPALEERYVIPDVRQGHYIPVTDRREVSVVPVPEEEVMNTAFNGETVGSSPPRTGMHPSPAVYDERQDVESWLAAAPRSIILGGPGSGKSSLLRFVAIDLLQELPRLTILPQKWSDFLPVWVPFALWTKMISESDDDACSLSALLRSWLRRWNEERLWFLVEQALEDDRLLLLVDGLDEWTNESAAKIALDQLQVFIRQRDVPAIVTSRPRGFDRLRMAETGWQIGQLSGFSGTQQRQLSRIWFAHRLRSLRQDSTREEDIERKVDTETEEFLTELHKSVDLRELAKVPLFLSLLIYHRMHNARLPQNRFTAYDSLVEHLIFTHPEKRRRAATLITEGFSELSDDDVKRILAYLAHEMQKRSPQGSIQYNEALKMVQGYLIDCDQGLGLDQHQAAQYSRQVLEYGEGAIGLLVRTSPKEVGFFHGVFREYLAAYDLSRIPLAEQLSAIELLCTDPQWYEVILGLFHLTSRAEDIKHFVNCIRTKREAANPVERYHIDLLLCEAAFGDFNCPVGLARELAGRAFEEVELGSWMPRRERVLQHILDGLRSTKLNELVKSKLRTWFPCRTRWREDIFKAMASWVRVPEVVECLWKGIHDESPSNQRTAGRALADLASGDSEIAGRIASLARTAVDPKTRAAAIEALSYRWPNHKGLEEILETARHSMSPELRLTAILGDIQKDRQTEKDRKELIRLGSWGAGIDYAWRADVASALMSGWPRSPETKETCFGILHRQTQYQALLDVELAMRILLEGYPQDEDVAHFCTDEIRHKQYSFGLSTHDVWRLISQNFRDHPQIVAAIDEWLPKQKYREPEVASAALVGRTPRAKSTLLSSLTSSVPWWSAGALIEGWGMQDSEVAEKLKQIAFGPAAVASQMGHLLPKIIEDKKRCRNRLLEVLRDRNCARPDFVMAGLKSLGNTRGDTEVVDTVLDALMNPSDTSSWHRWYVVGHLVTGYSWDKRVKKLAAAELSKRNGCYAAVASAYPADEEIRKRILEIVCPLPVPLRAIIAKHLGSSNNEALTMSLLKLYDHECDPQVKTQASISYHRRLKASGQDTKPAVKSLSESIVCYGPDHEERRQAAFCGLVTLGRLDVMVNAKERIGPDRLCAIYIVPVLSPNIPLLRHILQNWDHIRNALGDEFWPRMSKSGSGALHLWDALCLFAHEYSSPRDEAIRFLETNKKRTDRPNTLRFLARARPKNPLLLQYCLKALYIGDDQRDCSGEGALLLALKLLGTHFGGDADVLAHITSGHAKDHVYEKVILALCEGWPQSEELERILAMAKTQRRPLSDTTTFRVLCLKGTSRNVFSDFMAVLSNPETHDRWYSQVVTGSILRRLRADDSLHAMVTERLQKSPTPSEKVTIIRLIAATRGVSAELTNWCIAEIQRQLDGAESPEVGFDLTTGELRPVAHCLLDVLSQPTVTL